MKKKTTDQDRAVAAVKAKISPRVPCINADDDGYCTGPCEGSLCFKCASYEPRATGHEPSAEPSALTVRACDEITFPPGVETPGEKANFLHAYSIEASKRSTGAAILAGWVLSVARSTCAHGQWVQWLQSNVSFSRMTAQNYLTLYAQTVGARLVVGALEADRTFTRSCAVSVRVGMNAGYRRGNPRLHGSYCALLICGFLLHFSMVPSSGMYSLAAT